MSSIYTEIRATMETHLSAVTGIPEVAYENVDFFPTTGTPFVSVQLFASSRRPAVRGLNPQQRYEGIFRMDVHYPAGTGPNDAETMADTILEAFEATTDLALSGGGFVSIDYAERAQGTSDTPWYVIPISITFYTYKT
jgi:hypothetical protein